MAYQIPDDEPQSLTAGMTWQWNKSLGEFSPAEGYGLTYHLVGQSSLSFDAAADATNSGWTVSVPPTTTQAITAGPYRWTAVVKDGAGNTYPVGRGTLTILANPTVQEGADRRTHAQKMLALVEAEIEARITGTGGAHESYAIDGRSLNKIAMSELHALRSKYRSEVQAEQFGGVPAPVVMRFGRSRGQTSADAADCGWWP